MDRVIATNSVPFASRDLAPGSGTPQYFTPGVPGTTPATVVPGYFLNMLQDELRAVIVAAGITPDDTNWSQLLQAIMNLAGALGECRLSVNSTTQLLLSPFGGNRLTINGQTYKIPLGGITLANTGLTANTLYFIYAYVSGGAITLEASTTTHATDGAAGNYGVEVKTGDSTRTLVGMIYTGAGTPGTFVAPSSLSLLLLNWFNRRLISLVGMNINSSTGSAVAVGLGTASNFAFLVWSDEPVININLVGIGSNSVSGNLALVAVMMDGVLTGATSAVTMNGSTIANQPVAATISGTATEGYHTAQPGAAAPAGGTTSVQISLMGLFRG